MQLEHRLSALLQLHLHSRLNNWLHWIKQRQLQDETINIQVWGFGASYIRYFTVVINHNRELWSGGSSWHAIAIELMILTPCTVNYYGDKTCMVCGSSTLPTQAVSYNKLSLWIIIHLSLILVWGGQSVAMDYIHTLLGGRGIELKHVSFKYTTCPCRKFCSDVGVVCITSDWKGYTRNLTHDVDYNMW